MLEQARWWSWRRQRLDRSARGIEDALRSVIAITGLNPNAALALLARVPRMLPGMYEGSTRSKVAVRLPAMRRAIWLMATSTAHIPFRATRGTGSSERGVLRRAGVGEEHFNDLRARMLEVCQKPQTAIEIKEALGDDEEKVSGVINVLAASGDLVRVRAPNLFSNAFSFAAASAWMGPLPDMNNDDALAFLAGDYLQAYGPVTVDDFTWWSGVNRARCEAALLQHEPEVLDDGYLLWPTHLRAFEDTRPLAHRVNLLPAFDPYPMGYLDRSRLGTGEILGLATDRSEGSLPMVLVEARLTGTWSFTLNRFGSLTITATMYEEPGARLWESIEAEAGAVATLLGAHQLTVQRAEPRRAAAPKRRKPPVPAARRTEPSGTAGGAAKSAKRPAKAARSGQRGGGTRRR